MTFYTYVPTLRLLVRTPPTLLRTSAVFETKQRLAGSVPYVKSQEPHQLETYMPEVLKAFMESRMESVQIALRDGSEVFEDLNFIQQQLEQISTIARCEYPASCQVR